MKRRRGNNQSSSDHFKVEFFCRISATFLFCHSVPFNIKFLGRGMEEEERLLELSRVLMNAFKGFSRILQQIFMLQKYSFQKTLNNI